MSPRPPRCWNGIFEFLGTSGSMLTIEQNFGRLAAAADWLRGPDMKNFDGDAGQGVFLERPAILGTGFTGYNFLMGRNSYYHCKMQSPSNVVVGRYCSINGFATLGAVSHHPERLSTGLLDWDEELGDEIPAEIIRGPGFDPTIIGCDVWIGVGAVVLQGVSIGHGACIGANSVVTRSVPPYAIMAGAPAREVRMRFDDETRERLLSLRWWMMPSDVVRALPRDNIQEAIARMEAGHAATR